MLEYLCVLGPTSMISQHSPDCQKNILSKVLPTPRWTRPNTINSWQSLHTNILIFKLLGPLYCYLYSIKFNCEYIQKIWNSPVRFYICPSSQLISNTDSYILYMNSPSLLFGKINITLYTSLYCIPPLLVQRDLFGMIRHKHVMAALQRPEHQRVHRVLLHLLNERKKN